MVKYTFFSRRHRTFSKTDHKISLIKLIKHNIKEF
jgi:hypothetical protein